MRMNRRNVLVGLGTIVAGGGAALGTGAFSSVEASRSVSVETAGDANAFLTLTAADGADNYVNTGDTIEIDIGEDDGNGVNQNAQTRFEELIKIENQGTNDVESINFTIEGENGEDEILSVIDDFDLPLTTDEEDFETFGLEIELREDEVGDTSVNAYDNGDLGAFEPTITIKAQTETET